MMLMSGQQAKIISDKGIDDWHKASGFSKSKPFVFRQYKLVRKCVPE